MAHIKLHNVTLEYPIFTSRTRSIRTAVYSRLGGTLRSTDQTTIVQALNNINLELNEGDRLGIVGHNGAGKTTLLRVLSRIYEPQSGIVNIDGKVTCFTDLSLGMDPEADGWNNIIFRCIFMGLTFSEASKLMQPIAEFTELGEYLDMPVRTYSAGMFVRLAFAISTAVHPDIVVMDELISAGDAQFIDKAKNRLKELIGNSKILILASHQTDIITKLCNRAIWMEHGRIKAFGAADEITQQYTDSVVKEQYAETALLPTGNGQRDFP